MITTSVQTDRPHQKPLPDSIGFGFAELATLLNLRQGPGTKASAAALRLEKEMDDVSVLSAGASSLVARGLATAETGGELSVGGPVAAVSHALATATKHVEVALLTSEASDGVLSVESPDYSILLQPRAFLTWFAMARKPEITAEEALFYIVREHLTENPKGGATVRLYEDPDQRQLLIKRDGHLWTLGISFPGVKNIAETTGASDDDVLAGIRQIRQD